MVFLFVCFFYANSSVIEASFLTHITHFSLHCGNLLSELWSYGHLHTEAQTLFVKNNYDNYPFQVAKLCIIAVVIRC